MEKLQQANGSPAGYDKSCVLRPLSMADANLVSGLKLIEINGDLLLLYSIESGQIDGAYTTEIKTFSPLQNAAIDRPPSIFFRLLPVPPLWDARVNDTGDVEFVYESDGGATNGILLHTVPDQTNPIGVTHSFESFGRPHFVRVNRGATSSGVGATSDGKVVVHFAHPNDYPERAYTPLIEGAEGIVGKNRKTWVVVKNIVSGPVTYNISPGRLSIARITESDDPDGATINSSEPFPDLEVNEFDASSGGNDVFIFATAKPARLLRASRPSQSINFAAPNRSWLSSLSRPTILISATHIYVAAIANPGSKNAVVLFGELLLDTLSST